MENLNIFDKDDLKSLLNFKWGNAYPFIIAGPCVIEDFKTLDEIAAVLKGYSEELKFNLIFKASYDKANRTSVHSFRGPGIDNGLKMLFDIKKKYDIPVLSDVHSVSDIEKAKDVLDVIQIPAFLSRQTDILLEAAKTNKIVNVKKGQFLAPGDTKHIVEKIMSAGNNKIILTERGVSFGYNNLVVDFRALQIMREFGALVVFDATHSVQLPGGSGSSSSGERKHVMPLARAASAVGVDGIFFEVHTDPPRALSDSANSVYLSSFKSDLKNVLEISKYSGI
ncbi:MAG: 3-deoxy-8-phosphooctulonate synthase [Deltaproteobacteria bacterium]|jgi:2-dehydro-3-deoxyphosphooctonate aldolase (KDO 8-P synthase)|nr:3-deoxy-8-phosphooctulonate synthase [Deltaproteobacteria bacterium]MCL5880654.1 3-deoxy-8-phosphooctulonate synthase [Deltaproteobacteria bacterium]MDA8305165.1 3-deoxy-8-phosphooctulonate synthase [Deltaproteobacteria bacterium]